MARVFVVIAVTFVLGAFSACRVNPASAGRIPLPSPAEPPENGASGGEPCAARFMPAMSYPEIAQTAYELGQCGFDEAEIYRLVRAVF